MAGVGPGADGMSSTRATAEVFWAAFQAMKAEERKAFLERVVADDRIREDLLDAALIEERKGEPTRPLEEVLQQTRSTRGRRRR
jgi:hypothetical protein